MTTKAKVLQLRVSEKELEEMKELAKDRFEGNVSMFIRYLVREYKASKEVK